VDQDDPGLPIKLHPCSNGEFVPPPPTPVVREAVRRARAESDRLARRLGMSRRHFLQTLSGAAVALTALQACSDEAQRADPTTSTSGPGGRFELPPESTTEPAAATTVLAGEEFVLDVQGHLLEGGDAAGFGSGFPQASCGEDDPSACFTAERFLEEVFLRSDTSMIVLSAIPIAGPDNPLSIDVMERTRRMALELCQDERVLIQGQANPNLGRPQDQLDGMAVLAAEHPIVAWKAYTHAPGPAWRLDDDLGDAFLGQASALGKPVVCVHKGISGGSEAASPADVGPAAASHRDVNLLVYHSGYEFSSVEGPYDPGQPNGGVDRLVASLAAAGVGPNENVYAELGSTWRALMGKPDEAAHLLGKLLLHVGEDNVLWGTDSIWYGSPQDQIQAFRAFSITPELQERYGYPELTPERKAKILGLNTARLHGITPSAVACPFTREQLQQVREEVALPFRTYGPSTAADVRALLAAHGGSLPSPGDAPHRF
jgi:predicted TIM-barrel fold metal-dependent hydrolase